MVSTPLEGCLYLSPKTWLASSSSSPSSFLSLVSTLWKNRWNGIWWCVSRNGWWRRDERENKTLLHFQAGVEVRMKFQKREVKIKWWKAVEEDDLDPPASVFLAKVFLPRLFIREAKREEEKRTTRKTNDSETRQEDVFPFDSSSFFCWLNGRQEEWVSKPPADVSVGLHRFSLFPVFVSRFEKWR